MVGLIQGEGQALDKRKKIFFTKNVGKVRHGPKKKCGWMAARDSNVERILLIACVFSGK